MLHFFFSAIGGALTHAAALIMVGHYFEKHRGKAFGIATSFAGVGAVAFPPLAHIALTSYGFDGVLILTAEISVHMFVSAALFRPIENNHTNPFPSTQDKDPLNKDSDVSFRSRKYKSPQISNSKSIDFSILKNRTLLITCTGILFAQAAASVYNIMIISMATSRGLPHTWSKSLMGVVGAVEIFARLLLGFVYDIEVIRQRRRLVYGAFLMSLGLAVFATGGVCSYTFFAASAVIFAMGNSSMVSQRGTIYGDIVGSKKLSSAIAVGNFFQGLGVFFGPPVAGNRACLFCRTLWLNIQTFQ